MGELSSFSFTICDVPVKKRSPSRNKVAEYIGELVARGFKVIPVRSWGPTFKAAKAPMIPSGFEHTKYDTPEYQRIADELTRKTYEMALYGKLTAYGFLGAVNRRIILDFDAGKFPINKYEGVFTKLARAGCFVEVSSSGGRHVIIRAGNDNELFYGFESKEPGMDIKTFGYVVAHPSYIKAQNEVRHYRKLPESPELYENHAKLSEVLDILSEIVEVKPAKKGSRNITVKEVEAKPLSKLGATDGRRALACLAIIAGRIGCSGYAALLKAIVVKGEWPVPYMEYSRLCPWTMHCRSTWAIIEYNIGAALRMLGFPVEVAENVGQILEQVEPEDPAGTPATDAVLQGYRYAKWGLDWRGFCVLKKLKLCDREECPHNFITLLLARNNEVLAILRELKRKLGL